MCTIQYSFAVFGGFPYPIKDLVDPEFVNLVEAYHVGGMNLWRSAGVVPEPAKGVVWSIAAALDHQVLYYLHASYVNALTFFKIDERGVITFDYTPSVYENPNMGERLLAPMSIALNNRQTEILCPHDQDDYDYYDYDDDDDYDYDYYYYYY